MPLALPNRLAGRTRRAVRAVALTLAVAGAATLSACTGSDDTGGTAPTTAAPTTTSTTAVANPDLPQTATGANGNARDERIGPPANNRPSDGSLVEGSCFDEFIETRGNALLHRVQVVDCNRPHDGEVFAVIAVEAAAGAPYPGETEMTKLAGGRCLARFEPFVGREYATSTLRIAVLRPTATTWAAGDRSLVCSLYDENLKPLGGPARGSAR